MGWLLLAAAALMAAAIPALLFLANLRHFRPPPMGGASPPISVLIPARDEAHAIASALEAVLASRNVEIEVLVYDDHSTDATAAQVEEFAQRDERVRLIRGGPLPPGWCGKQHACWRLATQARFDRLAFLDADVRLAPDALARLAALLENRGAGLVSGFPRQETGTLLERLLIPLIHFVLLGFLPMGRMRRSSHPAYAAGCGQLFLARREAYFAAGGHTAIAASRHDGLTLPRAFRSAGWMTDVCDAGPIATCRMYRSAGEVWRGLAKNAIEGLAAPRLIGPASLLLIGGQVMPLVLLSASPWLPPAAGVLAALAATLAWLPRLIAVRRFDQSLLGAVMHPLGVALLIAIQWEALVRHLAGRPVGWKGRITSSSAVRPEPAWANAAESGQPDSRTMV